MTAASSMSAIRGTGGRRTADTSAHRTRTSGASRPPSRGAAPRRMLATEALLLSAVATMLGTVIGVGFAWVGYQTFLTPALSEPTMQIRGLSRCVVVFIAPWPDYSPVCSRHAGPPE